MKFTLSWLKDYLDTTATLEQIVDGLVGVGLEVEQVEDKTKLLAPFKVAYVIEAVKHPNADKLRLCKVETDTGVYQVVCGAPNARTRHEGHHGAAGGIHSGHRDYAGKGRDPRPGKPGHAVFGARAADQPGA